MSAGARFKLYGALGGGSAVVEVALTMAGLDYELIEAASWSGSQARERLAEVDFIGQIPVLAAPDGGIMTESAAMLLWLSEAAPEAGLAPPPGDSRRRPFLRWLMFLSAGVYASHAVSDRPERWIYDPTLHPRLKAAADERRKALWRAMEQAVSPRPFVLGEEMSVLDPYLAMISRWKPGRAWLHEACPKLAGVAAEAEAHPVVAEIWARNFPDAP